MATAHGGHGQGLPAQHPTFTLLGQSTGLSSSVLPSVSMYVPASKVRFPRTTVTRLRKEARNGNAGSVVVERPSTIRSRYVPSAVKKGLSKSGTNPLAL